MSITLAKAIIVDSLVLFWFKASVFCTQIIIAIIYYAGFSSIPEQSVSDSVALHEHEALLAN